MLFPIVIAIFYIQTSVFARNLEFSTSLSQLLSSGIKELHPIIIILTKSLDDDDDFQDNTLRKPGLRTGADDCKKLLREQLESKCSGEADCKEIVWKAAEILCEERNEEVIKALRSFE